VAHYGVAVEYALHILTRLARLRLEAPPSAKDLADFEGVPPASVAKTMTRLEKAGLVEALEGKGGGYRLARPAERIRFLDVVDAVEGDKPLFECREVRAKCVLHGGKPPPYANLCAIHAVMLSAEQRMREHLAGVSIADIAAPLEAATPPQRRAVMLRWFADRKI